MQAYGSDRVRQQGERWILASRRDKGWIARVPKTLTSAEFPGTAVLCEDQYFEVVSIDVLPAGGVRYALEPWRDNNAIRVSDRYDEEREAAREEAYRKSVLREQQRKGANFLAVFTGHLPAIVQNTIGNELGVLPARLTFASIIGVYTVLAAIVAFCVARVIAQQGFPPALSLAGGFLGIENTIRFFIVWSQDRPIGSVGGWILYTLYYAITRRGPSPFAYEKGWKVTITEAPPDVAERDAFITREPFVTLLTPEEQHRVAQRYDYDYRRHSTNLALIILIGSVIGVASSFHANRIVPGVLAALLALEQVVRLIAFRRRPAASVLRYLARPYPRKLFPP